MTVGERIRQRRIELGLTQEELAKRLGNKTRASVCRVEKDKEDMTTERIRKYAEALECEPGDLVGWNGNQEAHDRLVSAYIYNDRLKNYSPEQIIRALDFLDAFQTASPDARAMIEGYLKSRRSDP